MPGTSTEYLLRVNRAIDHVLANLAEPLRLEELAAIACFSPCHFHRIFKALVGETLSDFVTRLRLERSLRMLAHDPRANLTRVAMACGFGSSSNFSRVFKQRYSVPPSQFDLQALREERRAELQSSMGPSSTAPHIDKWPPSENPDNFEVRLCELPPRSVAYIRVLEPFQPGRVTAAADRLVAWAVKRELAGGAWLGYMWDDPDIVALRDCRYDVGVVVPGIKPEGEIGCLDFPAMRVAELEIRGDIALEVRALDWLYGGWLPSSGFVPSELPCFEAWLGRPFEHGLEHFELRVQLPIERA